MVLATDAALGLANRFQVVVDGFDLGSWAKCTGLSVKFEMEDVWEGGNYDFRILLPKRVVYSNVTLARAMTKVDSARVQSWLSDKALNFRASQANIKLFDHHLEEVGSWTLRNAYPSNWKCPDLDALGGKIALETLELAHEGFL